MTNEVCHFLFTSGRLPLIIVISLVPRKETKSPPSDSANFTRVYDGQKGTFLFSWIFTIKPFFDIEVVEIGGNRSSSGHGVENHSNSLSTIFVPIMIHPNNQKHNHQTRNYRCSYNHIIILEPSHCFICPWESVHEGLEGT
jgi:hypothetical protein